jgi:erythromycin esterase-like protein
VRDVCGRQVLLLGEDANHGSGATLALKVELVKRLVNECHNSAVLFESQVYDFIDLEHAIAARTATPALERDAIGGEAFNVRDRAMFENLRWHLGRLPKDAKVIVWCATVHAAKGAIANGTNVPLGALVHDAFGDRAFVVGFSALTGSVGRPWRPATPLDAASPSSLEGRAMAEFRGDIRYLDRQQLSAFGEVVGRALNYRRPEPANWAALLDGLVVLREERPQGTGDGRLVRHARG